MALMAPPVSYQSKKTDTWARLFSLLLLVSPVILVGWVVLTYAINLPYWDDFQVQDHQLVLMSGSGSQKLKHLFDQHWEHRIVWTRLIFSLFVKINGSLNYYGLTIIGVSGLLAVLGLLFAVFRQLALPLLYFVPVPFLLFTLQSYENLIWAMASIQNFWILAFALGAFYGLAQNTTGRRLLALGLAIAATFTSGNGSLVLIAGLMVLVYQRHWRFAGYWTLAAILSIGGYFYTYHRISFFPSPFRYPVTDWVKAFFVFLGAFADPSPNAGVGLLSQETTLWLTMTVGVVVVIGVGAFLVSLFRSYTARKVDPLSSFFLGCILFLFATAAITVYSRVGFAGPGYLLQGRYKINSALALSVVYLVSLYTWQKKAFLYRYALGVIVLCIGPSLLSDYLCLEGIINQRRRVVAEYISYLANTPTERQQAIRAVFVPTEPTFLSNRIAQLSASSWWLAPTTITVDSVGDQPFIYTIPKADSPNPTLLQPENGSYILFKNLTHTYLFAARPVRPASSILTGFSDYFAADGFYAQVLKEKLQPGRYRIGVLTNQNNRAHLAMTDRYVTFTSL